MAAARAWLVNERAWLLHNPGCCPATSACAHPGGTPDGFPTLVPAHGNVSMLVTSVPGVKLSGMIFDAGPVNSPALLQVGFGGRGWSDPADPTLVQDVFFRIGGAAPGQATDSLVVNSSQVILDDVWAWRADHGNGVGWTSNVGDTGVVVNGNDVTAYGLFVEHYEKAEVIWNGNNGGIINVSARRRDHGITVVRATPIP